MDNKYNRISQRYLNKSIDNIGKSKNTIIKLVNSILDLPFLKNRITLIGFIPFYLLLTDDSQYQDTMEGWIFFSTKLILFSSCFGLTKFGLVTHKYSKLVNIIIKSNGGEGLDDDLRELYTGMNKWKIFGYCEAQGMYLACKEHGFNDTFKEFKKRHSKNIIPNF